MSEQEETKPATIEDLQKAHMAALALAEEEARSTLGKLNTELSGKARPIMKEFEDWKAEAMLLRDQRLNKAEDTHRRALSRVNEEYRKEKEAAKNDFATERDAKVTAQKDTMDPINTWYEETKKAIDTKKAADIEAAEKAIADGRENIRKAKDAASKKAAEAQMQPAAG